MRKVKIHLFYVLIFSLLLVSCDDSSDDNGSGLVTLYSTNLKEEDGIVYSLSLDGKLYNWGKYPVLGDYGVNPTPNFLAFKPAKAKEFFKSTTVSKVVCQINVLGKFGVTCFSIENFSFKSARS